MSRFILGSGEMYVELVAADVTRFLDRAAGMGLQLWDVTWENDLTVRFHISRNSFKKLIILANRHGSELRIISQNGLYWYILNLLKRPVFSIGILVFLFLGIYLPGRIFFLEVQGNSMVEAARILEAASESGIKFGSSRRLVRSEQVKNQLIGLIPELQWVGVNTKGCVAVISVREKELRMPVDLDTQPCDIVALRDGIILERSVTRGTLLCDVGEAVSKGDILISGSSNALHIDTVTGASGEVFAATQRDIQVLTPDFSWIREGESHSRVNFSLQIGKNLINFFKGSGISGGSCDKMYSKYVLTLPGGFTLPVALIKWTTDSRRIISQGIPENEAGEILSDFASCYLENQMIAGRIILKEELLVQSENVYQLTGAYACTEMIGRGQKEQIGAYHGKTD